MKEEVSGFFNYLEIQRRLPRNGPGHETCTKRALHSIPSLYSRNKVLDIGYGNGLQTIELARQIPGSSIVAIDVHDPSVSQLSEFLKDGSLRDRISLVQGSLDLRSVNDEKFDLLWCESSIPTLGLTESLQYWRRVLAPEGCLGFIDICWIADSRTEEASEFWRARYPEMKCIGETLSCLENSGYRCLNWFTLPDFAWWDEYLTPLSETLDSLRGKIGSSIDRYFDAELDLIELCKNSNGSFAGVFFTAKPLTH